MLAALCCCIVQPENTPHRTSDAQVASVRGTIIFPFQLFCVVGDVRGIAAVPLLARCCTVAAVDMLLIGCCRCYPVSLVRLE
jgi:hypothetical protein